ncbi:hypothetical protein BaRGS_00030975 [Batillaria attramentaria]|uniref:Uncharacterized protein n=1 Tax=Batillaria attramentaria TaxID=370345 RepID=A0ABD0JSG4_9CAEN
MCNVQFFRVVISGPQPQPPPYEVLELEREKQWKSFRSRLADFPHSFLLDDKGHLTQDKLKRLEKGLQSALGVGHETVLETARARNLLGYVHWLSKDSTQALLETEKVLAMDGQQMNILSLANKAVMLWWTGDLKEAEKQVDMLDKLRSVHDFDYLLVKAKAELAFSYTRFGPKCESMAIETFRAIIGNSEARATEAQVWKFGLGLTLRRNLKARLASAVCDKDRSAEGYSELLHVFSEPLRLFQDVIGHSDCPSLKAKAYAEIGLLLCMPAEKTALKDDLCENAGLTPSEACRRALSLDSTDNSVLCKSAKIFRYDRTIDLERPCELLKIAIARRPTATAYHQLGLTYKARAAKAKREQAGGNDCQVRPLGLDEEAEGNGLERHLAQTSLHDPTSASSASTGTACATSSSNNSKSATNALKKVAKSPLGCVTKFKKTDAFVEETVCYLKQGVKFSEDCNMLGIYDLALIYKDLGQLEDAQELLEKMVLDRQHYGEFDKINAYEQRGLVHLEQSKLETDVEKKANLKRKGKAMLYTALSTASKQFSKTPEVRERIGEVWNSPAALFKAVEESDESRRDKLREKAKLFHLIRRYRESLDVLQEIDEQEQPEPEDAKLRIENYVGLQEFGKAVTDLELSRFTLQNPVQLFGDEQFMKKLYIRAATQALVDDSAIAKTYFNSAFEDTFRETRSSITWDVMFLSERENEGAAETLAKLLDDACGLKVTWNEKDVALGTLRLNGVHEVMDKSQVVIVLAGHPSLSDELLFYISHAVLRPTTLTLLVNGTHVPKMLKGLRYLSLECLRELVGVERRADHQGRYSEKEALDIRILFSFLLNVVVD